MLKPPPKNQTISHKTPSMSYRQYKTGFKKSLWEQEEFNNCYSEESKYNRARYSRSLHSLTHQRQQHTNYLGAPRWTDKVSDQFYSYNRAIGVDGGYCRNQILAKYMDKGCKSGGNGCNGYGKIEMKEGHAMIFGAKNCGHEKTMNLHGQKRRVIGNLASHGYSSCSDSDCYSESDSGSD